MKKRDLLRRVLPLVLAAIIVLGTLFGLLASVAYAADTGTVTTAKVYTLTGDGIDPAKKATVGRGTYSEWRLTLTLGASYGPQDVTELKLDNSNDLFSSGTDLRFSYLGASNTGNNRFIFIVKKVEVLRETSIIPMTLKLRGMDVMLLNQTVAELPGGGGYSNSGSNYASSSSSSSEKEVLTTPKMIITGFSAPKMVNPGEGFELSFTFLNNSSRKNLENISVMVTAPETAPIINTTNKRHFVTIPRRKDASETFQMKLSKEAKLEVIPVTIKFTYEYLLDGAYVEKTSEEIIYINATPKPEEKKVETTTEGEISAFDLLSVVPPVDCYPNEEAYAVARVINKDHRFNASNVQVSVVGDGLTNSGNTVYHGALNKSTQAEIDLPMTFDEPGTYTVKAIVVYEDSVGKDEKNNPIVRINEVEKEFTVTVKEPPAVGSMTMPETEAPAKPGGLSAIMAMVSTVPVAVWWIAGVVLVVGVPLTIILIKKRKNKAGAEDEDI